MLTVFYDSIWQHRLSVNILSPSLFFLLREAWKIEVGLVLFVTARPWEKQKKKSNLVVCKPSIVNLPGMFTHVCVRVRAWGCWKLSVFTWILIFVLLNFCFLIAVSRSGVMLLFYKALWRVMFYVRDFIFSCSKTQGSSRGSTELKSYTKAHVTSSFDKEFLLPS